MTQLHDRAGHNYPDWTTWVEQLRVAFEPKLTMTEWGQLVEGRKQLNGESGVQYALDKMRLYRRWPIALPEADLIPYLIRGLSRPELVAILMAASPPSMSELTTVRCLELLGQLQPSEPANVSAFAVATPANFSDITEAMKVFGTQLVEQLGQIVRPLAREQSMTMAGGFKESEGFPAQRNFVL